MLCFSLIFNTNIWAQTPYWEYNFTNGSFNDEQGNDNLISSGFSKTADRKGVANNAILFPGSANSLKGGSHNFDNITIGLWVKTSINQSQERTITNQYYNEGAGLNDYGCEVLLADGKARVNAIFGTQIGPNYNSNFQSGDVLNSTSTITDDQWHHIAFTAKKTTGTNGVHGYDFKLYIDGLLEDSKSVSRTISGYSDHRLIGDHAHFFISEDNYSNNTISIAQKYQDNLDDINVFETALTPSEILTLAETRSSEIIYVNQSATGTNDGSSWTNAFTDLQLALGYANIEGDSVFVAKGSYTPNTKTESFVIADGISVFGGFIGAENSITERDIMTNITALSGDILGNDQAVSYTETTRSDNAYNVIQPGKNVVIDGFTISGGHAMNQGNTVQRSGGAIVRIHSSAQEDALVIQNCIIKDNTAWAQAAGIYCDFRPAGQNTSVTINNCEFYNNISTVGSAVSIVNRTSGLLSFNNSNSLYHHNRIENESTRDGLAGSALFLFSIAANSNLTAKLTNITITENIDNGTGNGSNTPIAYRVNTSNAKLYLEVYNSIISKPAPETTFGLQSNSATQKMDELTIFNTRIDESSFSNYAKQETTGNLTDVAPIFSDINTNDFTLTSANTDLINKGDNTYVTATFDLSGNARITDNTVDMGAYEYGGTITSLTNVNHSTSFYPNPAKDIVYTGAGKVEIIDINGLVVLAETTQESINISHLSSGVYFIKINNLISKLIISQ